MRIVNELAMLFPRGSRASDDIYMREMCVCVHYFSRAIYIGLLGREIRYKNGLKVR